METNDRAEVAVDDVHGRMMAFVDGPEEVIEDEEDQEVDASTLLEGEQEEETEESDQEDADDASIMEIQWGEEKKLVTKAQAKEYAEQGYNYTQKMQGLAERERVTTVREQQFQQQVQIQTQLSDVVAEAKSIETQLAQYKQIDWGGLAEQDPVQYLKLNQTYRDLKEARDGLAQEYNQKFNHLSQSQQQAREQIRQAETKLLTQKIPVFAGDKAEATKARIQEFLGSEGFSHEEIGGILDHRLISVAWKAAQYDKLKAANPAINKRVANAPKIVKSGDRVNQKSADQNDLRMKLRKTGRDDIAAKLIEGML